MSLGNFFSRLKPKSSAVISNSLLDQKLVRNNQRYSFPKWSQLKYLFHFLNKTEKRLVIVGFVVIIISALSGLSLFVSKHLATAPKDGGDYSEALIGQPKYINPLFSPANDIDADISTLVYAGLFHYNNNQILEPYLAANYSVSTDQKIYDIKLKPNLKWSDGEPLSINDILYTFELIQNPEVGSPLYATFQGIKIEKTNSDSIRFILKEPFAPFLSSLTTGILPEHIWGDIAYSSIRLTKNNLQPIGAGPYQFNKMLKGSSGKIDSYTLTRNENFFDIKPHFQTITFKFFDEYTSAIEALRGQNVDALAFIPAQQKSKIGAKNLIPYNLTLPQYTALFFNQKEAPSLSQDNVRLALAEAIDRQTIIKEALSGSGAAIASPILSNNIGYNSALKAPDFNLVNANKLLDDKWPRIQPEEYFKMHVDNLIKSHQPEIDNLKKSSSTPEIIDATQKKITEDANNFVRSQMNSSQTFYRRDKDKNILSLTISTVDSSEYTKIAEIIAGLWRKIGVETNITTVDSRQIARELFKDHNYQVLLYGEIIGQDPDPYPFWHSSQIDYPGLNLAQYSNRATDKLLEDARATLDIGKRSDLYKKFQDLLNKDLPAIFLYSPLHTFAINNRIKGVTVGFLNSPSDRFSNIANWYVKTKLKWKN